MYASSTYGICRRFHCLPYWPKKNYSTAILFDASFPSVIYIIRIKLDDRRSVWIIGGTCFNSSWKIHSCIQDQQPLPVDVKLATCTKSYSSTSYSFLTFSRERFLTFSRETYCLPLHHLHPGATHWVPMSLLDIFKPYSGRWESIFYA